MLTHSRLDQINKAFQAMTMDKDISERSVWIIMSGISLLEKIRIKEDFDEEQALLEIYIIFMGVLALVKLYQNQKPVQLKIEEKKSDQTVYPKVDSVIVDIGKQIMHEDLPFDFTAFATSYPDLLPELNAVHSIFYKEPIFTDFPPRIVT
jgi:hypothetical protein